MHAQEMQNVIFAKNSVIRILYVSYDGLLEPLGESQVVAYMEGLAERTRMTVISFEKDRDCCDPARKEAMRSRLEHKGIEWIPLRYHKQPPIISTAFDVCCAMIAGMLLVRSGRFQIVHARGYVPALLALAFKHLWGAKFLFDMRGFWADEKVDAGHWRKDSMIYRITKGWERRFFESADAIVSLTQAGVAAFPSLGYRLRSQTSIAVIPTCTDLRRFTPGTRDEALAARLGLDGHLVIGCTGTISNWYLRQPMLECLAYLAQHLDRVKILMVTHEDHRKLTLDANRAGIPDEQLVLVKVQFSAMPAYLRLMDFGLFFIKPCFSKKGSSATKLGEFLATGIPVVINNGVGDSGRIVQEHGVGVVLPETGARDIAASVVKIKELLSDPLVRIRCRETAEQYFDLQRGVEMYGALYAQLGGALASNHT